MRLFRKKSQSEKLEKKYKKVLEEAFKLSKTNRTDSDKKYVEANEILNQIELIKKAEKK
jgi:hypothetical protein